MARPRKTPFEIVTGNLASLSKDELELLRRLIHDRLDNYDEIQRAAQEARQSGNTVTVGNRRGRGWWTELKIINGYGPYEYKRWREFDSSKGKKVIRSLYLGKPK